jgi:hypothetical protein
VFRPGFSAWGSQFIMLFLFESLVPSIHFLTMNVRKPSYFLFVGIIGVLAVLIGFGRTFLIPVAAGTFQAPLIIYVHGGFAFAWVLLFLMQTILLRKGQLPVHRRMGYTGVIVALGAAVTMIPAGLYQIERDLIKGLGETAVSSIVGVITTAVIFFGLVTAGVIYRSRPQVHKRLMLLATLTLLWPAWFRFRHYFPAVPRPDIWFALVLADLFIVIAIVWELVYYKKVHPVLLYVGLFIIAEHVLEVVNFDSPYWRTMAAFVYSVVKY